VKFPIPGVSRVRIRVLVVEDETIVAKDMEHMLQTIGCETETASSGEDSVRKAESDRPDVVFMDIRLKGRMDGIEAARRITEVLNIPVIYVTALDEERPSDRAETTTRPPRIMKPFEELEIERIIKKFAPGENN
jgi:CheY-like chemotaxis protein